MWSPRRILRNGRSALRRDAMDWRLCYGRGEYPSTMTDGFYRRPNTIKSIVATVAIAALVFVSYTVNENPLTVFECGIHADTSRHRLSAPRHACLMPLASKTSPSSCQARRRRQRRCCDCPLVHTDRHRRQQHCNTRERPLNPYRHPCRPVERRWVWSPAVISDMTVARALW